MIFTVLRSILKENITIAGQDAPRIHAGEEGSFLIWGEE